MGREYPECPRVGVGSIIFNGESVAMIRRANEPRKGHWALPGGMVELGETLLDAVVRESREETGLEVEPVAMLELVDRIIPDGERIRYHYVIADYLCRVTGGELRAGDDAAEVRWVGREDWVLHGEYGFDEVALRIVEAGWQLLQQRS